MERALLRILLSVSILFGSLLAYAQSASVSGQVTDSQGAVVPAAVVRVSNSGTKASVEATASDVGKYAVPLLPAGQYHMVVSAEGFTSFETDIEITKEALELDVTLTVAKTKSEVNVVGNATTEVETQSSEVTGTITAKEVPTYGLNGRNFTQLTALVAGVSNQTGQDEARVGMAGSVSFSVNGGRTEYNSFQVDGSEIINVGIHKDKTSLIVTPSIDAIQEIKVLTSNYGAMYPSAGNGTTLVTTKSGTDSLHGTLYEFLRNEWFNAKGYFDVGNRAPLYRRHDFGGTIGGPVYIPRVYDGKGKTYFFFSEEVRLEKDPYAYRQAVPSLAERNGDFSDVCPVIAPGQTVATFQRAQYPDCPSQMTNPGGVAVTYGNNILPLNRNALVTLGTGLIPLPTDTTGCNSSVGSCYNAEVSLPTYWREELFRLDHKFSDKLSANFRYIHDEWSTTTNVPQFAYIQNSFPTIQNQFYGPGISMTAHLVKGSSSVLNDLGFGYTDQKITLADIPAANVTLAGSDLLATGGTGMTTIFNNGSGGKYPGIVIAGNNQAYGGKGFAVDPAYMPWKHTNPVYSVSDNLSKVMGRHTLQTGLQLVIFQRNQTNGSIGAATGDTQGLLTFSNVIGANTTGNSFADFLSGRSIASFQQDSSQQQYRQRYMIGEPYIQDDYKVNSRLTLNLGLRVSLFGTYHELNNNAYNFIPSSYDQSVAATLVVGSQGQLIDKLTGQNIEMNPNNPLAGLDPRLFNGIVQCGVNGVPSGCMTGRLINPAPRIGFALDPFGTGKTAIRGGYGMFFEHGTADEANTGSLEGGAPLVLDMTHLNPTDWNTIGVAQDGKSLTFPLNVTSIPNAEVWPYVQQWSLSVQQQLDQKSLLGIAYVGSKGTNLPVELQINQLKPVAASQNPYRPGQPIIVSGFNAITTNPLNQNSGDCGMTVVNGTTVGTLVNGTTVQGAPLINLEAACYGVGQQTVNPNSLREQYPGFGEIYSLQNVANSSYNSLQVTFRRTTKPLVLGVAYTYSHSIDDASDRSDSTFVNSYDLKSNRASSNFDQRHLLNVSYIYKLPLISWLEALQRAPECNKDDIDCVVRVTPDLGEVQHSNWTQKVLQNWELSGITTLQSGTPFTVVNDGSPGGIGALDNAGVANGSGAGSYPDRCGNPNGSIPSGGNNSSSFGPLLLNPGGFCAPQGLTFGNAGRNALRNPGRFNSDIALLRHFALPREGTSIEFRTEIFNVFNNTQFRIYDPLLGNQANNTVSCYGGLGSGYSAGGGDGTNCLTGSAFLHPVSAHRPRTFQFGLKVLF
jgi:hypothetical protein